MARQTIHGHRVRSRWQAVRSWAQPGTIGSRRTLAAAVAAALCAGLGTAAFAQNPSAPTAPVTEAYFEGLRERVRGAARAAGKTRSRS